MESLGGRRLSDRFNQHGRHHPFAAQEKKKTDGLGAPPKGEEKNHHTDQPAGFHQVEE
jgi:hypothetical protein